jgi:ankyrin repeat protein
MLEFLNYQPYIAILSGEYHLPIRANYKQYNYNRDEIFSLVHKGNYKEISALIKRGMCINNLRNENDQTLLHYALQYNQLEIARILMATGAILDTKDKNGNSPYDIIRLMDLSETLYLKKLDKTTQEIVQANEYEEITEVDVVGCLPTECIIL